MGIALAISSVLTYPKEQVEHDPRWAGTAWTQNSCGTAVTLLDRGLMVQALLVPLIVFLLPGPGSILQRKVAAPVARPRALARPEDHARGRSRKWATSPDARSLITVIAVIVGVVGLLILLRSGLVLRSLTLASGQTVPTSRSWLRSIVSSEIAINLLFGLAAIGGAVFLLYLYLPRRPALFMLVGWFSAATIPIAWWYGVRGYATSHGLCPMLVDLHPVNALQYDYISECAHYFIYLSGFAALWLGAVAGGLRLQAERAGETLLPRTELQLFQNFFWVYWLGWAVQYRYSQWLTEPTPRTNVEQEWIAWSVMCFVYLTASSLWSLAFVRLFWNWRLRAWWANIGVALAVSIAIPLLTMLTFFWLLWWAPLALVSLGKWNVCGAVWAVTVGMWRWNDLSKQPLAAAAPAPAQNVQGQTADARAQQPPTATPALPQQEQRPRLLGLRALEIAAICIAGFLLIAFLLSATGLYIMLHTAQRQR